MRCPSCGASVTQGAWICPVCDHILDPSVVEPVSFDDTDPEEPTLLPGVQKALAWQAGEDDDGVPDAMILGDVGVAENEFSVLPGAGAPDGRRTSSFLFYAAGSSTRVIRGDAVPRVVSRSPELPRTPYEDFLLSCIDGVRTVREIQTASGLAPQEVVVTMLTMLDKGLLDIRTRDGEPGASPRPSSPTNGDSYDLEPVMPQPWGSAADGQASAHVPPPDSPSGLGQAPIFSEFDDLPVISDLQVIEAPSERDPSSPSSSRFEAPIPQEEEEDTLTGLTNELDPFLDLGNLDDVWSDVTSEPSSSEPSDLDLGSPTAPKIPPERTSPLPGPTAPRPIPGSGLPGLPPIRNARGSRASLPPVQPRDTRPEEGGASIRNARGSRASLPPVQPRDTRPEEGGASIGEPSMRSRPVRPPPAATKTPRAEAPLLDPSFLREVRNPTPPPRPRPAPKRNPAAPRPAPRPRRPTGVGELSGADRERMQRSRKRQVAQAALAKPSDSVRMMKAQKLFEQALRDKADGNLISARMNMKLALTFDPINALYAEAFEELAKDASLSPSRPAAKSRARELYDQATDAENTGDFDEAISLLEKAIDESKQPAFYNRLGVLLAMKRQDYSRAQELIEKAIELAPGNTVYEKNLQKILARAATDDVKMRTAGDAKKGGLLSFLGRRK